jgi:hypothetical protein
MVDEKQKQKQQQSRQQSRQQQQQQQPSRQQQQQPSRQQQDDVEHQPQHEGSPLTGKGGSSQHYFYNKARSSSDTHMSFDGGHDDEKVSVIGRGERKE